MLEVGAAARAARRRDEARCGWRQADARSLPFDDGTFDALTFTYLLRYVDDPAATLRELARVVRPGGTIAGLEFGVPRGVWRPPWELWVRVGLPGAGRRDRPRLARGRRRSSARRSATTTTGGRCRGSLDAWRDAGIDDVRAKRLSPRRRDRDVGTQEDVRPAFYALGGGGWRDYVTLLHPPYTLWHLSYVAVGAALAPRFHTDRHAVGDRRVLPRDGRRRARARRAARAAAADAHPVAGARRARRRLARRRGRDRRRRGDRVGLGPARLRRGRRGPRAGVQPRARASTPTSASRSPGARSPRSPATSSRRRRSASRRSRRPRSRSPRASRSGRSRRRSGSARRREGTTAGIEPLERALRLLTWATVALAVALVAARLR